MADVFVMLNGRVCRVVGTLEDGGPQLVKGPIVVGTRVLRSTAGKRPGPGWKPDPSGDKRKWVSHQDIVETRVIERANIISGEWPVGLSKHNAPMDAVMTIVSQFMNRAVTVGGAKARRVRPQLSYEAFEAPFKREGLPMPTESELEAALDAAWELRKPQAPKRPVPVSADGRVIIPASAPTSGDAPPAGVTLKSGHFWSAALGRELPDNEDGKLANLSASANGWPWHYLEGAAKRARGLAGYTLAFTSKTKYDPDRYGAATKNDDSIESNDSPSDSEILGTSDTETE